MRGRERRVSSYRWPLLLVLCCLREGGEGPGGNRETQLCCGQEGKKIQRAESNRSDFISDKRLDKPATIPSSSAATGYLATPSCCLQVALSGQQGRVGAAADH